MNRPTSDVIRSVRRLIATVNRDPGFVAQVAEVGPTTLVVRATDTGRALRIVLDAQGAQAHAYGGEPFDVEVRATERVHQAIFFGEMDPDAAFFAGRVRISGSILKAFRIKNRFLGLLQQHLATGAELLQGQALGIE